MSTATCRCGEPIALLAGTSTIWVDGHIGFICRDGEPHGPDAGNVARLLAEYDVDEASVMRTIAAFQQALHEHGIPDHSGGCPGPGCRCAEFHDVITARAHEILGIPPP